MWGITLDYDFALRVDAQGHPRIAYYLKDSSNNVLLYYAWSNANSLTVTGWSSYTVNYPTNDDYRWTWRWTARAGRRWHLPPMSST